MATDDHDHAARIAWSRTGGICGLAGIAAYMAAAFVPLPPIATYTAAFAFGPLLAVGLMGLAQCLAARRPGPLPLIAAAFGTAAGFTVLIMLTVQQAIFGMLGRLPAGEEGSPARASYEQLEAGLDAIHFGIDVAWDVAISVAVVLFAAAMIRDARFGPVLGWLGGALGLLLLGFNLWHFPVPPAGADSIDWGPAVALWLLAVFVFLLRAGRAEKASLPAG